METNFAIKHTKKYFCDCCDFSCYLKTDYERHLLRPKHQKNTEINEKTAIQDKVDKNIPSNFVCENCNKIYKERSGLWKHKKKCCPTIQPEYNPDAKLTEFIIEMIKNNHDLQKNIMEHFTTKDQEI
jgi:hypothetical protein